MREFKVGDSVINVSDEGVGCGISIGDIFLINKTNADDEVIHFIDRDGDQRMRLAKHYSPWVSVETTSDPINHPEHYQSESGITGGRVNYYLARIDHPQREDQPAYTAECEDIIEALRMTPDEANIFKEIWRSSNARLGNGKPDHRALYGAEKINHYAGRNLRRHQREAQK